MLSPSINRFKKSGQRAGWSLLELILVLGILAIIATLIFLAVRTVRIKRDDTRRLTDIVNLRNVLTAYYQDNNIYPPSSSLLPQASLLGRGDKVYLASTPVNPDYLGDTVCSDNGANVYFYQQTDNGQGYKLRYCLQGQVEELNAGVYCATNQALQTDCCGGSCSQLPANLCQDNKTIKTYTHGFCSLLTTDCQYDSSLTDCGSQYCYNGACVGCLDDSHCQIPSYCSGQVAVSTVGSTCAGHSCTTVQNDCTALGKICSAGQCVTCLTNSDCGSCQQCSAGSCVDETGQDLRCGAAPNFVCDGGACKKWQEVDPTIFNAHFFSFGVSNSSPYIAYEGSTVADNCGDGGNKERVIVKNFNGSQWVAVGPNNGCISSPFYDTSYIKILGDSNALYVAYQVTNNGGGPIGIQKWSNGAWNSVNGNPYNASWPGLASYQDNVYLSYARGNCSGGNTIEIDTADQSLTSLNSLGTVCNNGLKSNLVTDGSGNLYLATNDLIQEYNLSGWTTLASSLGSSVLPVMAVGANDALYTVYLTGSQATSKIFVKKYAGAVMSDLLPSGLTIGADTATTHGLDIAVDPAHSDRLYAAYCVRTASQTVGGVSYFQYNLKVDQYSNNVWSNISTSASPWMYGGCYQSLILDQGVLYNAYGNCLPNGSGLCNMGVSIRKLIVSP